MASRKSRKKARVENKKIGSSHKPKKSIFKNKLVTRGLIAVVVVVLLYFWISSSMAPPYVPGADGRPGYGPEDATVEVIQFGCFTCPFTKQFNTQVFNTLREEFGDRVRFVYRNAPIASNIGSEAAALASLCAEDQGKFWEYSDLLFRSASYDRATLVSHALALDLNQDEFVSCLENEVHKDQVREDIRDARRARVGLTPTLFVNGVKVEGVHDINTVYRRLLNDMLQENS